MSGLDVVVDMDAETAPWRQVRDQILRATLTGALPSGARLPPIRQFARDLGLAPGTVARTYHDLESQNWVRTARAKGTVVTGAAAGPDTRELRVAAKRFADRAAELGVSAEVAAHTAVAALGSQNGK